MDTLLKKLQQLYKFFGVKKISISISLLFICLTAICQYDTTAPYLKTKLLPDFKLLALDSTIFTQTILKEKNTTVIMLFNPDCGHCQDQLNTLLSIPAFTQKTQLVLTSTETLAKLKLFYEKNHLEKYPNIYIGKDNKYFFGGYYQLKTIPLLAFYSAEKKLIFFNQGNVKKKQIIQALKK